VPLSYLIVAFSWIIKQACLALYIVTASFGNPLIDAKGWRIPFIQVLRTKQLPAGNKPL